MAEAEFEAIVLGGGPGGYVCGIRLAQLGVRVVCVEAESYGGVCLNWGCIPSKALISSAHVLTQAREGATAGIEIPSAAVNPGKLQDWKDGIVKKLSGGVQQLLQANGAALRRGVGRLVDARTVEVTLADGTKETLRATKAVVVATGSETVRIPGFDVDGQLVLSAKEAVSLRRIPEHLVVIGGGVIGLELGMAYQTFGSRLTVVELTDRLLPGVDPECVRFVERRLKKRGGAILTSAKAAGLERRADGRGVLSVTVGGETRQLECDAVLVAVGMKPRSKGLGLEELGVRLDQRGFVETDARCETNVPGVYAIGDVSGMPMLAHKASKEGEVCAEVIAGKASAKDWSVIPGIVFTDPEIATVGLSEEDAARTGRRVKVGKFPFAALGRAMCLRETDGVVKCVTDAETGRVLGVQIAGPSASDLISEAVLAIEMVAQAEDLALAVHPHPTLGESLMEASAASLGHAIHIVNR